jgi:glycyl-tRNA synthetase
MVYERDDIEGLDSSIILNRLVWKYSGHEDTFSDPLVDCRECKTRLRADKLTDGKCPNCGSTNLTEPRPFNLMFRTHVGAASEDEESSLVYLRPETAQGIFINFNNVLTTSRRKLPFGVAQIGKSFRNEVTPGNFIFRTREFEQMEMEYFVRPGEDEKVHQEWIDACRDWFLELGIAGDNLRLYEQPKEELAHYAKRTVDVQYRFFPEREDAEKQWDELMGIANRTDFDLRTHSKKPEDAEGKRLNPDSTEDLSYFDEPTKERFYPFVIEPAAGVNRTVLAVLMDAYTEKTNDKGETRVILKLHPALAPIKAAVLPLAKNKPEIVALARSIKRSLQPSLRAVYDDTGGIGKLYARQDEIGTPFCVTVDHQSLEDNEVTVRDRDTWEQERVKISELEEYLLKRLKA